jgi:hypothetical protein
VADRLATAAPPGDAGVDDRERAVGPWFVAGPRAVARRLKEIRQPRDLVPGAGVAGEVDAGHGRQGRDVVAPPHETQGGEGEDPVAGGFQRGHDGLGRNPAAMEGLRDFVNATLA